MPKTVCKREEVGEHPKGIRWGFGPIVFEEYTTDDEPNLSLSHRGSLTHPRFIAWRRLKRTDIPKGWHQLSSKPFRVDGYSLVNAAYTAQWKKNARRDLRLWQEQHLEKTHTIENVSFEEFSAAYKKSTVAHKIGLELLRVLERKLADPRHIQLWGVRNKHSGEIIAGTAAVYSPTFKSSIRECPFILEEAKPCFAMTGLMAHWFEHSLRNGTTLHVYTHFKQQGDPRDWKGFSEFKSHFTTALVAQPPALWRFVGGKLF
jgi:hypothetical protein